MVCFVGVFFCGVGWCDLLYLCVCLFISFTIFISCGLFFYNYQKCNNITTEH